MPPPTPTGLTATPSGQTTVDLTWDASAGALGYDVERNDIVIANDHSLTAYGDAALNPATEYSYRVRATGADGDSAWTDAVTAITEPESDSFPSTSGTSQYRLLLLAPPTAPDAGEVREELSDAVLNAVRWELNRPGSFAFSMPTVSRRIRTVDAAEEEVLVLRNGRRIHWGVPVRPRSLPDVSDVQCLGLLWYLWKRVVGDADRPNYVNNSSFENDTPGQKVPTDWQEGPDPLEDCEVIDTAGAGDGNAVLGTQVVRLTETRSAQDWLIYGRTGTAEPHDTTARLVARNSRDREGVGQEIDNRVVAAGDRILLVSQSDSKLNGIWIAAAGAWARAGDYDTDGEIRNSRVKVLDGREYALTGWKNTDNNAIDVGTDPINYRQYAYTRIRPRVSYIRQGEEIDVGTRRGSTWAIRAYFRIRSMQAAPHKNRGSMLELVNGDTGKVVKQRVFSITEDTEQNRWLPAPVQMRIPNKVSSPKMRIYLYGPTGIIDWDATGLFYRERLLIGETNKGIAAEKLIDHAQDPAFGKSTLNFDVVVDGDIDAVTDAQHYHDKHANIGGALTDLTKGSDGIDFYLDEDTRTVHVVKERSSTRTDLALELGRNIADFEYLEDGEPVANTVITLGPGEGPARAEGYARRPGTLSDMVYEKVVAVDGPMRYLDKRAAAIAEQDKVVREIVSVTTYALGSQFYDPVLIDHLRCGMRVPVRIRRGRVQINGLRRVYAIDLDPRTDVMTIRFNP